MGRQSLPRRLTAVIMSDRIDTGVAAIEIGRRSLGIARQSMIPGIGLSLVAMAFAGVIDVAVIVNALRARGA